MALGIYVDRSGEVLVSGGSGPDDAVCVDVGRLPVDASGQPEAESLVGLLRDHGFTDSLRGSCVASPLVDYPTSARLRAVSGARWVSSSVALGLDYAAREFAQLDQDITFFALHHEGDLYTLATLIWGDGVMEVVANETVVAEAYERATDCCARLLESALPYLQEGNAYPLIYASERTDFFELLERACGRVREAYARRTHSTLKASLHICPQALERIACGALIESLILCGEADDWLLVDSQSVSVSLAWGSHRLDLMSAGVAIPADATLRIAPQPGERLCLELSTFAERGLKLRYPIPHNAVRLDELARAGQALDVTLTVGVDGDGSVELTGPDWKERFALSQLVLAGLQEAAAPEREAPPEPPAGLMELIASLDDVDLGLRALDVDALASPAGEGLRALQARLEQAIAKLGAEHYPALGMTFDPHLHQAFSAVEMDGAGRDQIVDELRRGYRYEGRIIRYSLVQVANPRR